MQKRIIENFKQLQQEGLSPEQCWYALYLSISKTQKALELKFDELDDSPFKESMFMYVLEHNLCELLEKHFFNVPIGFSPKAFEEARNFFVLWMDDKNTMDLSRYLNYLDGWHEAYPNWKYNSPVGFANMVIVRKD